MINPLTELKKRLTPRSRWGAINIAPPREFGRLTWPDAENRRQPQDGALSNTDCILDEPEVSPIPQAKAAAPIAMDVQVPKPAMSLSRSTQRLAS